MINLATDYRDSTPLTDVQKASLVRLATAIRTKMYGKDVREAIASAIEMVGAPGVNSYFTPKGVVADLAALESEFPNGSDGIYITKDDGYWCYWDGNTWQKGNVYQSAGIADNSISLPKLKSVKLSKIGNLIDYDALEQGTISASTGLDKDSTQSVRTDYIDISGISYMYTSFGKDNCIYAFYDANKQYIGKTVPDETEGNVLTVPDNSAYMRFCFSMSAYQDSYNNQSGYIRDATVPLTEKTRYEISKFLLNNDNLYYFSDKINLDLTSFDSGYPDAATGEIILDDSGIDFTSDYIETKCNSKLTLFNIVNDTGLGANNVAFYDASKNFIYKSDNDYSHWIHTFQVDIPKGARYMKIHVHNIGGNAVWSYAFGPYDFDDLVNGLSADDDEAGSFDQLSIDASASVSVDESKIGQKYLGGYIEIQPDSYDGSTATDSTTDTWGFPYSILGTERNKIKDRILSGNGKGIMYIRFPLGFGYRGYRNIDSTTGLAKNIGERFSGQNSSLKSFLSSISESGGGLAPEYWCPAPYWVTSESYSGVNNLRAGGSYSQSTTLESIKSSDPTQYNKQINDFTDAIVDDLEYLHQNVAPVRMFGLQNEPSGTEANYGACGYNAQMYNDVLEVLYPKIKASTILSTYNDEPNEVKLHVASSLENDPFGGVAKTFITNHADWIWGYSHHLTRYISGESYATGAEWYKTSDFETIKGSKSNVFCNEYEYFETGLSDDFRCSNNMLHLINEMVYGGAEVLHPVIHILKPIGQTSHNTNTKGYCLYAANLKGDFGTDATDATDNLAKGTIKTNPTMFNSWAMFNDNLPVGSYLVGDYTTQIDRGGYAIFKYAGKLIIFLANNSDTNLSLTLNFDTDKSFSGKFYNVKNVGTVLADKEGKSIKFNLTGYSGQCWIEK